MKGIGPATAALIVDRFGDRALDVMLTSPGDLAAIRGISAAKAKQISASFRQQAGVRMLMEFVCSFGLRPVLAMRLTVVFKRLPSIMKSWHRRLSKETGMWTIWSERSRHTA